jgi:PKHD-type hydroxylase
MKNYYIRKILDSESLKKINQIIEESNKSNYWVDGLSSGGGHKRVKNNLELYNVEFSQTINNMIMNCLDVDDNFISYTVPKSTNLNIVSKTFSGGYYNPHVDNWINGDYSTTLFLNDSSEYDGGELCLYFGGEDEVKIKLNAGWGITYSTGTLHRVNKVISGNRYVSVFWTKSLITDPFIRHLYGELSNIQQSISEKDDIFHLSNCISVEKDPHFRLNVLKMDLLRRYAQN